MDGPLDWSINIFEGSFYNFNSYSWKLSSKLLFSQSDEIKAFIAQTQFQRHLLKENS